MKTIDALNWATTIMPTGKAQAALARAYNEMMKEPADQARDERIIVFLAYCVIDGLCYGNWIGHTSEECFALAAKKQAAAIARGE